jgi:AGZA family xanthine/uracil permease-like MFS transporter
MRWFVRGDVDGFFGLALDNLVQLLVIVALCGGVLGFPSSILLGHVLPGSAAALLLGNLFYAWQAKRLAESTGRSDICSLPYGINTPSVFLFVFLVMLPVKLAQGPDVSPEDAALAAWRAGLIACLGSGLIELIGSLIAEPIRRATPRAALLSTLAGIAIGFISMPFLFEAMADPLVGLVPLAIIFVVYFGAMRFKGGLPGGLIAVLVGTALFWGRGIIDGTAEFNLPTENFGVYLPVPVLGDLWAGLTALGGAGLGAFLSVVLAMGVLNVIGSMQNIESAEAAGDSFPTRPSLAVNGLGTIAGALFGSCFPTTIYIGHPGWKALGARAGYNILNGIFCTIICCTGTVAIIGALVPMTATMAIVIWIALIITAQAFQTTPREHAPAVVVGLLPGIAAWGVLMLKGGMRAAEFPLPWFAHADGLEQAFAGMNLAVTGAWSLDQGALFTCMIYAAATVAIISRQWRQAALWFGIAAVLSACGLMHGYAYGAADVILALGPVWPFVITYALIAGFMLLVPKIAVPSERTH